jgi:uracil-DNA glycosylase
MVQETGPRLRVVLLGRGNAAAVDVAKDVRVLFVGQVSGLTKIAKRLPFTGPAGRWLDGWFFEAAVSRAMIYLSALAAYRKSEKWRVQSVFPSDARQLPAAPVARIRALVARGSGPGLGLAIRGLLSVGRPRRHSARPQYAMG